MFCLSMACELQIHLEGSGAEQESKMEGELKI